MMLRELSLTITKRNITWFVVAFVIVQVLHLRMNLRSVGKGHPQVGDDDDDDDYGDYDCCCGFEDCGGGWEVDDYCYHHLHPLRLDHLWQSEGTLAFGAAVVIVSRDL